MKEIWLVVSHWRNAAEVTAFVARASRLPLASSAALRVAICDNSGDFPASADLPAFVVQPGRNLGYLRGCATALATLRRESFASPEWVVVANTDIELPSDFFERVLGQKFPVDLGILAPSIHLEDGSPQNPLLRGRPSRAAMFVYSVLAQTRAFPFLLDTTLDLRYRLRRSLEPFNHELIPIYAAHGSIFLLHSRLLERGVSLEHLSFMYGEEIHLAEQVLRLGLRVYMNPTLPVIHTAHSVLGGVDRSLKRQWHAESASAIWAEYFETRG